MSSSAAPYLPAPSISSYENTLARTQQVLFWTRLKQSCVFSEPSTVTSLSMASSHPYTVATTAGLRLSLLHPDREEQSTLMMKLKRAVFGVAMRADAMLLGVGGEEGKVRVLDCFAPSGKGAPKAALRTWKVCEGSVHGVAFSLSHTHIFSLDDDGVLKQFHFSANSHLPLFSHKVHSDAARVLLPSGLNEHIVATGSFDRTVKLWDVRCASESGPSMSVDVGAPVESALFLPREQVLAVAAGPSLRFVDMCMGGRSLACVSNHHKAITSMCLARANSHLLTASIDKRLNVVSVEDFSLIHSTSLPSPVMSIASSPNDEHVAIAMGNLIALYGRKEESQDKSTSLFSSHISAPLNRKGMKVTVEERKEEKKVVEALTQTTAEARLSKEDNLLRKYSHAAAVTRIFSGKGKKAMDRPDVTVGHLSVIVNRKAATRALAGQSNTILINIAKFLRRYLFHSQYFSTLSVVALALADVCVDKKEPGVDAHVRRLKEGMSRELGVQKEIAQSLGVLSMLCTTT